MESPGFRVSQGLRFEGWGFYAFALLILGRRLSGTNLRAL